MFSKTIKTGLVLCMALLHLHSPISPAHLAQLKAELRLGEALALVKK
jgi:hypothetical protein